MKKKKKQRSAEATEENTATKKTDASEESEQLEVDEVEDASGMLIEKNIKWSQLIYDQNKKIQRRLTFLVIGNYVRLLLIFIPIIIGILYVLPFVGQEMEAYSAFQFFQENLNSQAGIERLIEQFSNQ